MVAMAVPGGGHRGGGRPLAGPAPDWQRPAGSGVVLCRDTGTGTGLRECVPDAILICGGSFSISGRHRPDHLVRRRAKPDIASVPGRTGGSFGGADVATNRDIPEPG